MLKLQKKVQMLRKEAAEKAVQIGADELIAAAVKEVQQVSHPSLRVTLIPFSKEADSPV